MDSNDNIIDERYTKENEVNKSPRGTHGVSTFMLLLFAILFVAIGVYLIGAYYGYFPEDVIKKVSVKVSSWFFVYIGVLFILDSIRKCNRSV